MISLSFSFKQGQFYELCTHLLCAENSFCWFDQVKDEFENGNPLSSFVVGQNVKAKVLVKPRKKRTASRAGVGDHLFELSLRPSQLTGAASCLSLYFSCSVSHSVFGIVKYVQMASRATCAYVAQFAHAMFRCFMSCLCRGDFHVARYAYTY